MVTGASSFMQTKPGCPAKCGNVSIPYPFGIFDAAGGEGCSINKGWIGYAITCNTSFDPPKPFLGKGNLQVLSISESEIRVKNNQVARRCFTESGVVVGKRFPTTSHLMKCRTPYTGVLSHSHTPKTGYLLLAATLQPVSRLMLWIVTRRKLHMKTYRVCHHVIAEQKL
ncbi:hypothetical protein MKW92_002946 [Papaver armeniacum]|nr:hypothetical protein MKW92_002946 [Papaver armeniacum]